MRTQDKVVVTFVWGLIAFEFFSYLILIAKNLFIHVLLPPPRTPSYSCSKSLFSSLSLVCSAPVITGPPLSRLVPPTTSQYF